MKDLGLRIFIVSYILGFIVGIFVTTEAYRQFDIIVLKGTSLTAAEYRSVITVSLVLAVFTMIVTLIGLIGLLLISMEKKRTEKV